MRMSNFKIIVAVVLATAILFFMSDQVIEPESHNQQKTGVYMEDSFVYKRTEEVIHGYPQVIHKITLDIRDPRLEIVPVLSDDSIFGYETTSAMATRHNAKAAINGGFFYEYGQPSGLVIIDGKLLHTGMNMQAAPTLVIDNKRNAMLMDVSTRLWAEIGDHIVNLDGINREPGMDEIILFTPEYGYDTRMDGINTYNTIIRQEKTAGLSCTYEAINIPRDGLIITGTGKRMEEIVQSNINNGLTVKIHVDTKSIDSSSVVHAYEGGFWVVKNGVDVMRPEEKWVGLTINREPRTVVGIEEPTGRVVFLVVDGRQPGYSLGFNGEELAAYLLQHHVNNAIMLDGGASSTMVMNGAVVNRPSYRGEERTVGGALIVKFDK